jgi:hypothetical protein
MSDTTSSPPRTWRDRLREVNAVSPLAANLGAVMMLLSNVTSVLAMVQPDYFILGTNGWMKPTRFSLSFGLYSLSVQWLVSFLREQTPRLRKLVTTIALTSLLESLGVTLQAARGTRSHFNVETPFDALVYLGMGVAVLVLFIASVKVMLHVFRHALGDEPVFALGLRAGLLVTVVGMTVPLLMLGVRDYQKVEAKRVGHLRTAGAHAVGVPDGGPGLPLTHWSTEAGDLRVGHMVGIHALQLLPLAAWLLARARRPRLSVAQRVELVRVLASMYLGLMVALTVQALRGQPVLAPDGFTLGSFTAVLMFGLGAAAWVVRPGASTPPEVHGVE